MADLATLAIRVDSSGAIQSVERFGNAAEKSTKQTAGLERGLVGFGRRASETERQAQAFARQLASMGDLSRGTAVKITSAAAAMAGAFGPTGILAIAGAGFVGRWFEQQRTIRDEMAKTVKDWEESVARMVNAGDTAALHKAAQDLWVGTPANEFKDGIVAARAEVQRLLELQQTIPGALSAMFNTEPLENAQKKLADLTAQFETLQRRLTDPRYRPFQAPGMAPIVSAATTGRVAVSGGSGVVNTTAQELDAMEQLIRQHYADAATAFRNRMDDEAANEQALADVIAQHHRDSAEAFAFRMDQEEGAQRRLGDWVNRFREGVGRLFSGGALGTLVAGGIGGVFTKLADSLLNGGRAQKEAAEAVRAAAMEFERITEASRRAFGQSLADFASFGNGESDLSRALRQQRERAGSLGVDAYDRWASQFDPKNARHREMLESVPKLQGQDDLAPWLAWFEKQYADWIAMGDAFETSDNPMAHLYRELKQLQTALGANEAQVKALAKAERAMQVARQVSGLQGFRDSLLLSAQSPLSPTAQLAEAKRQYDLMLALAKGGDESAIASIPESARAFLDASRAVNASGARYADTFTKVTEDTNALIAALQADTPVQLDEILDVNSEQLAVQNEILAIQEAQVTVAREASARNDARLERLIEEVVSMKQTLKMTIEEIA